MARGNASGVENLNVDIVGVADSLTKVVTLMLIVIVVGVLLSAWVGGRVCSRLELLEDMNNRVMIYYKSKVGIRLLKRSVR